MQIASGNASLTVAKYRQCIQIELDVHKSTPSAQVIKSDLPTVLWLERLVEQRENNPYGRSKGNWDFEQVLFF